MELQEQVISWLAEQDLAIYLVGGCVRDLVLGRSIYDLDVTVHGDGLVLARRLANHFRGAYYPLDEARSTGRAILRDQGGHRLVVDVAQLRGADLEADLADRDFTINAMAADVRSPGDVIDHHGGLADLRAGSIRPVSEASIRNDPLRALRAVRQGAQLGFDLAPETRRLVRRDGAGLSEIAGERIRDEVVRLLAEAHAAPHLRLMDELGLLTLVVPELEPLRGLEQSPPHYLSVLDHSLETVRALEDLLDRQGGAHRASLQVPDTPPVDPTAAFAEKLAAHLEQTLSGYRSRMVTLKLAALLHDTGKPRAFGVDEGGRIRFFDHERDGVKIVGEVMGRLRFNNAEVRLAETIVQYHMRPLLLASQKTVSSRAVYRFFRDTGDAGVEVLLHSLADHRAIHMPGTGGEEWSQLAALTMRMLSDYWDRHQERVAPPQLIDGNDLLREFDLKPGPQIGELLEAVREGQVSGEVSTREEALSLVRQRLG